MTRQVDETIKLTSRAVRAELEPRYPPYWNSLDQGLHLGYRKSATGGLWLTRTYIGKGKYRRGEVLGVADDMSAANDGGERRRLAIHLLSPAGLEKIHLPGG